MATNAEKYAQAKDMLRQAKELLETLPAMSPAEQSIIPAHVFLQESAAILADKPDAGESGILRQRIYELIQSQKGSGNCAIYKELRCPIHLDLVGENGAPTTLACGHTYCIGCITPIINNPSMVARKCPECRIPITVQIGQLRENVAIKNITDRLQPRHGGGVKRKTMKNSKANATAKNTGKHVNKNLFQYVYLDKYVKEMGYPADTLIKIDHIKGLSYINGKSYRIIFPPSLINFINNIPKIKTNSYCFIGDITPNRKWVEDYKSKDSIIRATDKSKYNRNAYDETYYKDLCRSKFTLCPTGDCPWSYRFFEAIMCFSIPIMEKDTDDRFYKDYFCYTVGQKHAYDFSQALNNYRVFLNSNGPCKN